MKFFNLEEQKIFEQIDYFFHEWQQKGPEVVVVFSPHDDDALLGAGYAIISSLMNGAEVYVVIFHSGNAGYSNVKLKSEIVEIRRRETLQALQVLGIDEKHIIRLELPDFSGINYLGWFKPLDKSRDAIVGTFEVLVKKLREIGATRLLFANGYREHIDHHAVETTAIYYGPQVGDPICIDWGKPTRIRSYMRYAVWGKFRTEANFALVADEDDEHKIRAAIQKWDSQQDIIKGIMKKRNERKIDGGKFLELYQTVEPRPAIDFKPYLEKMKKCQ